MSSGSSLTTQDYVNQIPVRLRKALYKFQKEGVLYALKLKGRILIGDEMGLGKTIQAISVACAFRNWPCLVIAPAVVKLNWVDELEKWTGCEPSVIKVIEGRQDVDGWKDAKFVICTYGLFTRDAPVVEHIESHGFETVIVDESHSLKNDKAVRTRAIVPIIEKATHAILLSGTPALARPVELYPQVSSLSKSYFGTYSEYTRKFCNARRGRFGWDVSGAANLAELHGLLKHVMIRRKKDNVLTQLPKKLKSRVLIDLDAKSKKSMAKIMGQLKDVKSIMKATLEAEQRGSAKAKSDAFNAHKEQRRLLMRAFHDTGVAKLPGVKGYINNFLDSSPDNKCLIFGHHRDVLDGIESNVSTYRHVNKKGKKKRIAYIRIDGSTPHRERADNVRKFQSDPNCRVGILGILAGGVGITLTAASHVFFAELHWTPGILQQAEDRAHRIGQTAKNVHINYMVAKGSLDDIMWSIVCSKVNVVSCALEGTKQKLKVDVLKKKRGGGDHSSPVTIDSDEDESEALPDVLSKEKMKFARGDVRTFMFGQNSQNSSTQKEMQTWSCDMCTLINQAKKICCEACGTAKRKSQAAPATDSPPHTLNAVPSADISTKLPECEKLVEKKVSNFWFSASSYTGRIFLYSTEKVYFNAAFMPEDIKSKEDWLEFSKKYSLGELKPADCYTEIRSFLKKWNGLRAIDQQQLCGGYIFRPPLMALISRRRLATKHRGIYSPSSGSILSFTRYSKPGPGGQLKKDGHPALSAACRICKTAFEANVSAGKQGAAQWQSTFCSYKCFQQWKVRTSGSHIRRTVFDLEAGVCQLCNRDMHEIFLRYRSMSPPDRFQELLRLKFSTKGIDMNSAQIIHSPVEGHFWQADHIVPVAEGGGECDLTNFRTLCTPCHKKETSSLNQRLARKRLAESAKGTFDIRTFLTPSGEDSHVAATPATESRPRKKKPRTEPPSSAFLKPSPRVLKKDRKKHDFVDESSSDDEEDDLPIDQLTAKYLKERKLLNFMSP